MMSTHVVSAVGLPPRGVNRTGRRPAGGRALESPEIRSGMAITADVIEFTSSDTSALLDRMALMDSRGDGWINIGPGLTPEQFATLPARSGLASWFSGRGPAVPMATWSPRSTQGRGQPAQIGLAHGTGPDALVRLDEAGIALPPAWLKKQDHAKNGIVAEIPDGTSHHSVVEWVIRAMEALSPRIATGHDWVAEAYGG